MLAPCLQILAVRPMCAAGSHSQVVVLAHDLLQLPPALTYTDYDSACSVLRRLRGKRSSFPQDWQPVAGS